MKISPKQYGEALYQAVKGLPAACLPDRQGKASKKDSEIKTVIGNFVKVMAGNNNISKLDKIIEQFEKIWNREEGAVEAEIASARALDKKIVKLLNDYIAELSGVREVLLKQKIDKNILGGVVIKYGDRVLDGSLETKLKELREEMVK